MTRAKKIEQPADRFIVQYGPGDYMLLKLAPDATPADAESEVGGLARCVCGPVTQRDAIAWMEANR